MRPQQAFEDVSTFTCLRLKCRWVEKLFCLSFLYGCQSEKQMKRKQCSILPRLLLPNLFLFSSWPWLIQVTTSTLAWIPIMLATRFPTVVSASPSTGTGRFTTCTWGRKVCDLQVHASCRSNGPWPLHSAHMFFSFLFPGINTLINIMSRLGQDDPSPSR